MASIKTSRGQIIDFDALQRSAESSKPAIGNMGIDANGNKLGKGGKIVMSNEERVRRYYEDTEETSANKVSIKGDAPVTDINSDAETKTSKTAKENKRTAKKVKDEPAPAPVAEPDEFDAPDGQEPLGYKERELPNGDIEMVPYYREEDK